MPRKPMNETAMSGAERQRKYRDKDRAQIKHELRKIYAHNHYRLKINLMLVRLGWGIVWLANVSDVPQRIIEAGDEKDCGMFYTKEIEALSRALPQVLPPDRSLW